MIKIFSFDQTTRIRNALIIIALPLISLTLSAPLCALSWTEATALAEKNNNQIISAKKQEESSYWSYNRAMTAFFPQISLSLGGSKTNNPSTATLTRSFSYGVSASQSLFTGFANLFSLQTAYAQWQQDKANLDNTRSKVYYDMRSAYISLLVAQENVELQKQIVQRRKSNTRMIGLRYNSGIEDKGNYLMTKADEGQSVFQLDSAKRSVELARLRLSQIVGTDIATVEDLPLPKSLSGVDYSYLTETSVGYRIAKYALEISDIARRNTLSEFLPSVSVSGSLSKSGNTWPPQTDSSTVALNMSYPVFPGGSNIADYFINNVNYNKALQDFENTKKNLRYTIEQTALALNDGIEKHSADVFTASAGLERGKITQAKYLNGLMTFDAWNRIVNDAVQYQINALNSKKALLIAEAAYYNSFGGLIK